MKKNPDFKLSAIIACLVAMFSVGIVYLWSVFQQPVVDHYGWSVSSVTLVSSAIIFVYVLGSLIGGVLNDRRGPRFSIVLGAVLLCGGLFLSSLLTAALPVWVIYLTYGGMAGLGVGLVYSAALNVIQKWYPHRRGFATGISVCAFGLSSTVLGPLIDALIKHVGVPSTFRILAFTFPVVAFLCSFFVKPPSRAYLDGLHLSPAQSNQRDYAPAEAVRHLEFWCMALTNLFLPAAYMMIIPRVKTLAMARGMTESLATLTVSLTGVASAAARIIAATASDKVGRARTTWTLTLITLIASVCMTFATGWFYIAAVLLIVAGYSGPAGITPAMTSDSFGVKYSGTNYGMIFLFLGVSAPLFTLISNVVSASGAATGNYTAAFVIAAAGCVVPLVMLPLYDKAKKRRLAREVK